MKYTTFKMTLQSWMRATAGGIAMYMALMVPVLTGSIGMAIDVSQSYLVQERLSRALDAAALAVAGSSSLETQTEMEDRVKAFIAANYPAGKVGSPNNVQLVRNGDNITVSADADYNTTFLRLIGFDTIKTKAKSTVTRQYGANIELALVLDISGSMNSKGKSTDPKTKIEDLKTAAKSLIDTVVYADQSEYTAKVAIVPYAVAVNVGTYADDVRGKLMEPEALVNITGATKTNPVVITTDGHGFKNGNTVYITGVKGMTQINDRVFTVTSATATKFSLSGVSGTGYSTYSSNGTLGTAGLSCTTPGCRYYSFTNAASQSQTKTFQISTCVSERTGTHAYTEKPPGTSYVGRNYPAPTNPCLTNKIRPLSDDKTLLKADIDALTATGSTGGQVGIAWGWYVLSPEFGAQLWTDKQVPAAYGADKLYKIAVIMTDGELNSPYCNGVISKDALSGSGDTADHINCNATNGNTYSQGRKMCDEMKKAGIEIYTIGFRVDAYPNGKALMEYCAKDAAHFFESESGEDLVDAFQTIAKNVNRLYVSD